LVRKKKVREGIKERPISPERGSKRGFLIGISEKMDPITGKKKGLSEGEDPKWGSKDGDIVRGVSRKKEKNSKEKKRRRL